MIASVPEGEARRKEKRDSIIGERNNPLLSNKAKGQNEGRVQSDHAAKGGGHRPDSLSESCRNHYSGGKSIFHFPRRGRQTVATLWGLEINRGGKPGIGGVRKRRKPQRRGKEGRPEKRKRSRAFKTLKRNSTELQNAEQNLGCQRFGGGKGKIFEAVRGKAL